MLLGLLLYEPTLFPGGDNAHYMILGEALREGRGYRDLFLPGDPLHAKYPPLLPALLALLGWLGGLQLFKLAMLACTTATVWLTASAGRRLVGTAPALLAAGLLAVNPVLLEYSHYVLSEALFSALVMLAVWAATRGGGAVPSSSPGGRASEPAGPAGAAAAKGSSGAATGIGGAESPGAARWAVALAIGAAAGAFLTRTAGLALLAALPIAWGLARRRRRALLAAGAAAATMVAWGWYQRVAAPGQAGYLRELVLRDPYDPAAGAVGPAGLAIRAASNAWAYVGRVLPETLTGLAPGPGRGALPLLGVLLAGLALAGWVRRAGRAVGPAETFTLLYAGLIVLWPDVWTDRRFLLPLAPLLLLYAAGAGAGAAVWMRRAAPAALVAVVALPALAWSLGRVPERVRCVASWRAGAPCDAPAFASFYDAARWARDNTEPGAVIANRKPTLFYWHARRKGDLYRYSSEPEVVLRGLERMGADYVVVDQVSATTLRYLVPAIEEHRVRFEAVYEGGTPPTFILRFRPPPAAAARAIAPGKGAGPGGGRGGPAIRTVTAP